MDDQDNRFLPLLIPKEKVTMCQTLCSYLNAVIAFAKAVFIFLLGVMDMIAITVIRMAANARDTVLMFVPKNDKQRREVAVLLFLVVLYGMVFGWASLASALLYALIYLMIARTLFFNRA